MLRKLLSLATFLTAVSITLPAFADLILPGRCHMDRCSDTKFLGKSFLAQGSTGKLYEVELARRTWPADSEPPATFGSSFTVYIYCSTARPAYIFSIPTNSTYTVNLLNPGGNWVGYNQGSYPVYWATCHNFVGPDFFSEEMTNRAIQLGYPLNLTSEQIELTDIYDILD